LDGIGFYLALLVKLNGSAISNLPEAIERNQGISSRIWNLCLFAFRESVPFSQVTNMISIIDTRIRVNLGGISDD
jgi:hypothetical protein